MFWHCYIYLPDGATGEPNSSACYSLVTSQLFTLRFTAITGYPKYPCPVNIDRWGPCKISHLWMQLTADSDSSKCCWNKQHWVCMVQLLLYRQYANRSRSTRIHARVYKRKLPVVYFLLDGLNLINICVQRIHEVGITVPCVTCHDNASNMAMFAELGARMIYVPVKNKENYTNDAWRQRLTIDDVIVTKERDLLEIWAKSL